MQRAPRKNPTDSPLFRWREEVMRHIISILEKATVNGKITVDNIAHVVNQIYVDQTRAPWPGSYLSSEKKETWREFVERSSKILIYANGSAAFSEFASKISSRLLRELSAAQITSSLLSNDAVRDTQIEHMIRQEFYAQGSAEDTVSRSVQRYFREDARTRRNRTEIKTGENDPLRDLLGLPRIGRSLLPHEDIRVHMARYLSTPKVREHLNRASSFENQNMTDKLGNDFSEKCKPIGFADQHRKVLLVEVASPLVAQEITFNKPVLLSRLKKIQGFEKIVDIQFRISPRRSAKPPNRE